MSKAALSFLPEEVPAPLVSSWEDSGDPWGFKDHNARYLYANASFFDLLNLPLESNIERLPDTKQSDSHFSQFLSQFTEQEQQAKKTKKKVSSIETYCFGREEKIQPYLFDKFPLLNAKKEYIGIIFHGKKMDFFTGEQYRNHESPVNFLVEKPDDFLTDQEFEVLFYLCEDASDAVIAEALSLSEEEVAQHRKTIYQKAQAESLASLNDFCKKRGYQGYVPQKLLRPSSVIIPFTEWNLNDLDSEIAQN
ncbi:Response regulator containing a CheY-like receiver domain and an HTH DNA-binding domain [Candidatus Regiella insecticola 5.15]|uniref:Response regulator containing a CheY-like receiver domain and an HTH DNA-binding domain n=1 Tax=Candidatus Regiella insecticola 5.15 TaxID=1005043 RepID=G2H2A3_9ENTR|nr:PAS domain-containing protein [Candidatus Regiella insecticola]EGY27871.1 Response regulator containing a CheY-like receiver domain and an HTH DNA-binding domain [Candidatus Regiella insecticola 5.15]